MRHSSSSTASGGKKRLPLFIHHGLLVLVLVLGLVVSIWVGTEVGLRVASHFYPSLLLALPSLSQSYIEQNLA